ncbi:MAG: hypothetical protein ACRD6B_18155 [Bryobacteraceae bacterium]
MSKTWARNWWGAAWVEKMERLAEPKRFADGEQYVRSGRLQALRFDGHIIAARVEAPDEPPYNVRIFFDPFSRGQWESLLAQVRDRAALASSMVSGNLPLEMQTAFSKAKLRFMPERYADLHLECACPDWLKPCKHQIAVWLKFAREFDRQPFLLFELRGLKRPEFLTLLQSRQSAAVAEPEEEAFPEITIPPKPEALPADPAAFWSAPELPAVSAEAPGRLLLDDSVFDRLKDWPGVESQFHQIYDEVYELATLIRS